MCGKADYFSPRYIQQACNLEAVEAERRHLSTAPARRAAFSLQTLQGPVLAPANTSAPISAAKGSAPSYQGGAGLLFPRSWLLADAVPCKYLLPNSLGETLNYVWFFPSSAVSGLPQPRRMGWMLCLALYKLHPAASAPSLSNDSNPTISDLPPSSAWAGRA